jgi:hypothetical protein
VVLGLPPGAGGRAGPASGVVPHGLREAETAKLGQQLAAFGARLDALADGSLLVTLVAG